jgi:hypothetical protein
MRGIACNSRRGYFDGVRREFAVKHSAVSFLLLFSSLTLAGQNQGKTDAPTLIFNGNTIGNVCPIGMRASQGVWDHSIKVRQGEKESSVQPFGQRILLSLEDTHPDPIISATVRVHGLTGKNRILQTGEANADGDATKLMRITFGSNGTGGVSSDVYVSGFTSVSSIELLEISYADGKTWRIAGSSVCRVAPDPMMLIANH